MAPRWSEGYFVELPYSPGYYRELCPAHLRFCLLLKGLEPPASMGFDYCELTMGKGYSANVHAAANNGRFLGMDFLPAHVSYAKTMAECAKTGLQVSGQSLEEFCSDEAHGSHDYICMHGGWSWISARNRSHVTEFLKKRLKPGGIFYVSYNCWPGSSSAWPLRGLLTLFEEYYGSPGIAPKQRIMDSIALADAFLHCDPLFLNSSTWIGERFERLKTEETSYLAHEFYNEDWHVAWFRETAEQLGEARLAYAASARVRDNLGGFGLTQDAAKFMQNIQNEIVKEQLRDFLANEQFRTDIFGLGLMPLSKDKRIRLLENERFILMRDPAKFEYTLNCGMGVFGLDNDAHAEVADILRNDGCLAKSLGEIYQRVESKMDFFQLVAIIAHLVAKGYAHPCAPPPDESIHDACFRLNRFILENLDEDAKEVYLASPETGGGFRISGEEAVRLRQCGLCENVTRNDPAFPQFQLTLITAHGIIRNRESFPRGES